MDAETGEEIGDDGRLAQSADNHRASSVVPRFLHDQHRREEYVLGFVGLAGIADLHLQLIGVIGPDDLLERIDDTAGVFGVAAHIEPKPHVTGANAGFVVLRSSGPLHAANNAIRLSRRDLEDRAARVTIPLGEADVNRP
jgi:hypothetical protein